MSLGIYMYCYFSDSRNGNPRRDAITVHIWVIILSDGCSSHSYISTMYSLSVSFPSLFTLVLFSLLSPLFLLFAYLRIFFYFFFSLSFSFIFLYIHLFIYSLLLSFFLSFFSKRIGSIASVYALINMI